MTVAVTANDMRKAPQRIEKFLDNGPMSSSVLNLASTLCMSGQRLAAAMPLSRNLYRADHCNDNVANLVNQVMTAEERRVAHVFIFTHVRAATPELYWRKCFLLRPRAALEDGIAWSHHTVAELGGRIYDFDYRGAPGAPLSLYAHEMFAEGMSRCICRKIPAEDYVIKYKPRDMIFGENYPRFALSVIKESL